jgi:hypothetical protein
MPLFLFIFHTFYNIHPFIQSHLYNTFIRRHSLGPLSISSSLESGKTLPVVLSRELNSGLPYSKPTRYQLSRAAPFFCSLLFEGTFTSFFTDENL